MSSRERPLFFAASEICDLIRSKFEGISSEGDALMARSLHFSSVAGKSRVHQVGTPLQGVRLFRLAAKVDASDASERLGEASLPEQGKAESITAYDFLQRGS